MTQEDALNALKQVMDPELGNNIVDLGMVEGLVVDDNNVSFELVLTTPACPLKNKMKADAEAILLRHGAKSIEVRFGSSKPIHNANPKTGEASFIKLESFDGIKNIITVYSSKGGVGKSTVAVNLAVSLAKKGAKVGILDMDVYGPSIPRMLGIGDRPTVFGNKLIPIRKFGLNIMSLGLLMPNSDEPVIWRGPLATSAVRQLFEDVTWDDIDYLVLDLPPGTGDIQITIAQNIPIAGALFVTTPQAVAIDDTIKGIKMFEKLEIPVLGMVENMAYFVCPHCGDKTEIYPRAMETHMSPRVNALVLGELPIDPAIATGGDSGVPCVEEFPDSETAKAFSELADKVISGVCKSQAGK